MAGSHLPGAGLAVDGGLGDGRRPLADLPETFAHYGPGILGRRAYHKLGSHLHAAIVTERRNRRDSRTGKRGGVIVPGVWDGLLRLSQPAGGDAAAGATGRG